MITLLLLLVFLLLFFSGSNQKFTYMDPVNLNLIWKKNWDLLSTVTMTMEATFMHSCTHTNKHWNKKKKKIKSQKIGEKRISFGSSIEYWCLYNQYISSSNNNNNRICIHNIRFFHFVFLVWYPKIIEGKKPSFTFFYIPENRDIQHWASFMWMDEFSLFLIKNKNKRKIQLSN